MSRARMVLGAALLMSAPLLGGCKTYHCHNAAVNVGGSKHTCNGRCCVRNGRHITDRQVSDDAGGVAVDGELSVCGCDRRCPCQRGATYGG